MSSKDPEQCLFRDLDALLDWCGEIPFYGKQSQGKTVYYANVPMAFDIETTSTYINRKKAGFMYIWSFCINGGVIQGRTWPEWVKTCERLQERLGLGPDKYAIIFVRNLEFEFQFMRGWFEWDAVFAINTRHPAYARTVGGIEYRCSYILSGESLATSGAKLQKYPVRKLIGDLDYRKIRTSETQLTKQENGYCINDVRVDCCYIQEKMDEVDGMITRLQLTKTGYVRKYMRDCCFYAGSHKKAGWKRLQYQDKMRALTIEPLEEYPLLKRAFQGGFTHASARFSGTTQYNVDSWDLTSSYPASMVAFKYPMSSGEKIRITSAEQFRKQIDLYCCIFDVEFTNLCIRSNAPDCPISFSKCWKYKNVLENNGRVARADMIVTTCTEVDFKIYEQYYTWDSIRIGTFYRYRRGYLPKEIIQGLLDLYEDKTTLKGVPGKEQEYTLAKEKVNSCYGMMVTDIARAENVYNGKEWEETKPPDLAEVIEKYNDDPKRFLFYPWGVYITAYSRMRLFRAIWACGEEHYYYSDTDSCKIVNGDCMRPFFEAENADITRRIEKALRYHGIDPEKARPRTITGKVKPLGVWDYEGRYLRFRALRAKCYMVEEEDGINITVAGVNKRTAVPYLVKKYKDPFAAFTDCLTIPEGASGKLTHTYLDMPLKGEIEDYMGHIGPYDEKSAIHMESASYEMNLLPQYLDYLRGIQIDWRKAL